MSYYSNNYYPNYQYNNPYANQVQAQPSIAALQGKIVDSIDIVKVTEVPFGGFAIFPKGNMSEIYVKSWSNNGTTQIITYKPVVEMDKVETSPANTNELILQQIANLESKIDAFINSKKPIVIKDKEVNTNATK